jgi:hypothetical protein
VTSTKLLCLIYSFYNEDLFLSRLFVEILKQAPDVNEIQFNQDGNWTRLNTKKETHVIASPVVKSTRPAVSEPSGKCKLTISETPHYLCVNSVTL